MRRKLLVLIAVCLTSVVLPLDFSGAAAATPAIGRDLGGTPGQLAWVVNAFMLSFGSCVMAAGALADQLGRKKLFSLGAAGFVATSIAVAAAPTIIWLDLLRLAQGLTAAATLAAGSAALAQEFDGAARTRAFSVLGTTFGLGLALGPSLGGLMLGVIGWRGVFLSGGAVGLVALIVAVPRMRESRDPAARGLDVPGTLTFTAALGLFTYGLITAPEHALSTSLAIYFTALVALVGFIVVELRASRPMLDLSLLRYPRFIGVQALPLATACCYVVLLVLLPLRFIGLEHRSESESGALMLVLSAPMVVIPFVTASLARRVSPGLLSAAGLLVAAGGLVWLAGAGAPPIGPMLVIGTGAAMPWGLMDGLAVSVVPTERAGMAAGIFSTTRIAGEGLIIAAVVRHLAAFSALCTALAIATAAAAVVVYVCVGRSPARSVTAPCDPATR